MRNQFIKRELALAVLAALGSASLSIAPDVSVAAAGDPAGTYAAGDFHNHTTCSDGSLSMQKLVKKSTATWGLDWFVQAGHGGSGNRNCTLTEDATLGTPNFPFTNQGPTTTWANSIGNAALKGDNASTNGNMWRWQSLQSFQYQALEDQAVRKGVPLFLGLESVVAGHEHTSMSVITGQMPSGIDQLSPTNPAPNATLGNADALAQWSYCFDRGDTDTSRGTSNAWACSFAGSTVSGDTGSAATTSTTPWWSVTGQKLIPVGVPGATVTSGNGVGDRGHQKTVEAVKWMKANHPQGSYYVPAHLERAGPFNPLGNNGFNVEHLRNLNNAAPSVAFGMETQPGHPEFDTKRCKWLICLEASPSAATTARAFERWYRAS